MIIIYVFIYDTHMIIIYIYIYETHDNYICIYIRDMSTAVLGCLVFEL